MTIVSKLRLFNYWLSIVAIFGGVWAFFYFTFISIEKPTVAGSIMLYSCILLLLLIYVGNLYAANKISIDTDLKTISFKNRFSRKVTIYNFSDFDGKLTSYEPIKGETIKNLFLIKNKKAIIKISGMYYSNHKQIESCLDGIADLGQFNYYSLKTWKIKLGLAIIY